MELREKKCAYNFDFPRTFCLGKLKNKTKLLVKTMLDNKNKDEEEKLGWPVLKAHKHRHVNSGHCRKIIPM